MKKILRFTFLFVIFFSHVITNAQNWNAFNKNYRYNYIYNYNPLVTHVLFADSVKQLGSDTTYYMNRIGAECSGGCPTITTSITGTVLVVNLPQFLQRTIIKYANGTIKLNDTSAFVIKSNCALNEIWLFDALNNKNAQCISIATEPVFTITDSIKTILIDGTDTLKLSKNFGIIQFPNLYNKNKYYKLAGIENKATYDQTSLYGVKVLNDWDFYNFEVGDKFCYRNHTNYSSNNVTILKNITKTVEILSKTMIPNVGYNYTAFIKEEIAKSDNHPITNQIQTTWSTTATTSTLSYNTTTASTSNMMYPGKVIRINGGDIGHGFPQIISGYNIAKFGKDNFGKFYKYHGRNCMHYTNTILPNDTVNPYAYVTVNMSTPIYAQSNNDYFIAATYGEGLGMVTSIHDLRYENYECLTCAIKNNSLYLGEEIFVGLKENKTETNSLIYPNPVNDWLYINSTTGAILKIEIFNVTGRLILTSEINDPLTKLNVKTLASGIYFVKTYSASGLTEIKKLVKE